jgi:MFS family permease
MSGRLAGRVPALRLFCAGLLVVALSSAACATATGYLQLLIFRAVGGIGSTLFTVSAALLLIQITPPSLRRRATGAWATGFLLGTVAGPLLAGALIGVGLRAPFLIYSGLLVIVAIVSAILLRRCEGADAVVDRADGGVATFLGACRHTWSRCWPTHRAGPGWCWR